MGYAFISYSTKNQSHADSMRALLKKHKIDSWMAPYDIPIGSKYAMVINRAVKDCSCFILLLTDHAQNSVWVAKEVERAINYRKPIIPIQLEDLVLNDEFELYISSDQIVALPKIDESPTMAKILQGISAHTGISSSNSEPISEHVPKIEEDPIFMQKPQAISARKPNARTHARKLAEISSSSDFSNAASEKLSNYIDKLIEETSPVEENGNSDNNTDFSDYHLPSPEFLDESNDYLDTESIEYETKLAGEQLIQLLDDFKINTTLKKIDYGPRVTRYHIVPAKGVSINRIDRLNDDIALTLSAESVRIETPIPGTSAVGIEIPNKISSTVTLRELVDSKEFNLSTSKTCVCVGKSVDGTPIYSDIAKMAHAIIAGTTGMGKSVFINSMIASILYKARPDEVKFILIDPKKVEFSIYRDMPHLLVPIITEAKQTAGALAWAISEMNRRYELMANQMTKSVDSYNAKVIENPKLGAPLPKIVIIIDELSDLMIQLRDPIEYYIMLLAQKSRAAGIHLIIGTQRPTTDVITGIVKANIPTRISCKVASYSDSRTILDQGGAERLLNNGDMLFALPGSSPIRVQGAFVSENETSKIVEFIKSQTNGVHYDRDALIGISNEVNKLNSNDNAKSSDTYDDDPFKKFMRDENFIEAVSIAIDNGAVSTSFLQRKLRIGYGKAAQYIDAMEALEIIGCASGPKPRDILITMDEWSKKLDSTKG